MDKTIVVLAAMLATLLLAGPLVLAGFIATLVVVPASAFAVNCAGTLPATGQWRVPFVDTPYTVTSGFGMRLDPVTGASTSLHNGVDLATPQSPVVAAAATPACRKLLRFIPKVSRFLSRPAAVLGEACTTMTFRPDARRVFLLFTDEEPVYDSAH